MEKYYIWGAGIRGQRLLRNLGSDHIIGFIDQNISLQGTTLHGIPIISFEQYLKNNDSYYIIVSPLNSSIVSDIVSLLESHSIYHYFLTDDLPPHLYSGYQTFVTLADIFKSPIDEPVVLYGISFFTALTIEYLRNQGYHQIFVHPQRNYPVNRYQTFLSRFNLPDILPFDFCGSLYLMLSEVSEEAHFFFPNAICKDALLLSAAAIMTPIPCLQNFHNKHTGQRCFIVATGPSLQIKDLDTLHSHREISIGVNHIYKAYSHTLWRPNYYLCCDPVVLKDYSEELHKLEADHKFFGLYYPPFWDIPHDDHTYPFSVAYYKYSNTLPPFSDDFSRGVFEGWSITYPAIQFAVYAGFSEIYLIGCDHNYESSQAGGVGNHFVKDYQPKKLDTPQYQRDKVELAYRSARKYCDAHGIHIYNATRGGKLEVFERVDFDSLFTK